MNPLDFMAGFFTAYIVEAIFILIWSRRKGFKQYRQEKVSK